MNTPMQGAAADLIKLAMIELHKRLEDGFQSHMILQVHDELLFEGPEKEIPRLAETREGSDGRRPRAERADRRRNEGRTKLARHEMILDRYDLRLRRPTHPFPVAALPRSL